MIVSIHSNDLGSSGYCRRLNVRELFAPQSARRTAAFWSCEENAQQSIEEPDFSHGRSPEFGPTGDFIRRSPQEQIGDSISEILLHLGENYHREGMIEWLGIQAYPASRLAGRQKSAALLKQLAVDEHESGIAAKACLVLSEQYYGQYGCLARLEADATVPMSLHAEVAKMKIARVDWNARLKKQLRSYPMFAFEMSPFSDRIKGVRQELLMLVDDPDPELKTLACGILWHEYLKSPEACR